MQISITKNPNPGKMPPSDKLGFGSIFSDHMFVMDYTDAEKWHNARIIPYGNLEINPAASVLHYANEVFEGMKAYRWADGSVHLFRPMENAKRINISAERIGLPEIPNDIFLEAVREVVKVDKNWVPTGNGTSLYIRPFMFSLDPELALHGIHQAKFVIILSPSASYFAEGIKPVKIMLETEDVRAVRGGTGYTKCGGNYAASNRAGDRAMAKGYSQVLWLDGVHRKYIEEVGAMNVMFKIDGTVVTPSLENGSILSGITRKSCLEVLKSWGIPAEERLLSVDELIGAAESGKLEEAFGTGTAAVISPVGELFYNNKKYTVNNFKIGPVAQRLYDELTGIQWGTKPDTFGWTECV